MEIQKKENVQLNPKPKQFIDLKVPYFLNKKNGQMSITLPKREIKKFSQDQTNPMPKRLPIRIRKWW